jgi:hypothetical protein
LKQIDLSGVHTASIIRVLITGALRISDMSPKVVIEWLKLLLHIQEVPGSNLGPETGYPELFRGFH